MFVDRNGAKKIITTIRITEMTKEIINPEINIFLLFSLFFDIRVAIAVGNPNCARVMIKTIAGLASVYIDIPSNPMALVIKILAIIERPLENIPKEIIWSNVLNINFFFNFFTLFLEIRT